MCEHEALYYAEWGLHVIRTFFEISINIVKHHYNIRVDRLFYFFHNSLILHGIIHKIVFRYFVKLCRGECTQILQFLGGEGHPYFGHFTKEVQCTMDNVRNQIEHFLEQ